jgi:outer membrane protein
MNVLAPTPLILAALLLASGPALAQTKIGLLNVDRILRDSPTAQRVQAKLRDEFAAREQELAKGAAQLKAMQSQFESKALTMSDSERQARERELNEAGQTLQKQQRAFSEDANKRRQDELGAVFDRIYLAVKQIAEAEKFDMIFREATFGSPRIDITDKVIKVLDAGSPKAP